MVAIAVALLAVAVAGCWAIVAMAGSFPGDRKVAAEIAKENLGTVGLAPAHALDLLGEPPVALTVVAALTALTAWRLSLRAGALVLAALGASVITTLLKHLFNRERPPNGVELDPSFPSGHTAWATAVFGLMFILTLRHRRYWPAATAALIVAAMGPSRLLLGVHYLSDVLAGYAVGLAWLLLLTLIGLPWATSR
jgi:membrane-associated phospholipid phosphatase